jgi:membrane protein DedA with SNARE-associated domain
VPFDLADVSPLAAYALLFALIALESAGLPLPGESSLLAASVLAAHGVLFEPLVIAVAATAAIVGDNFGYLLGARFGRRAWLWGNVALERRERWLKETEHFFNRHGRPAVVAARFLPVARFTVAWMAGMSEMPWRSFLVWNAVGGIAWATIIGTLAYVIGSKAEGPLTAFGLVGLLGLTIGFIGHLAWQRVHRSRTRAGRMAP